MGPVQAAHKHVMSLENSCLAPLRALGSRLAIYFYQVGVGAQRNLAPIAAPAETGYGRLELDSLFSHRLRHTSYAATNAFFNTLLLLFQLPPSVD